MIVGGKEYALGQIENDILLDTSEDLRIHFAINCASVSCVNLAQEPYRGLTLFKQVEEQGYITWLPRRGSGQSASDERAMECANEKVLP